MQLPSHLSGNNDCRLSLSNHLNKFVPASKQGNWKRLQTVKRMSNLIKSEQRKINVSLWVCLKLTDIKTINENNYYNFTGSTLETVSNWVSKVCLCTIMIAFLHNFDRFCWAGYCNRPAAMQSTALVWKLSDTLTDTVNIAPG